VTLAKVQVINAADGTAAEWSRESALAEGVEFTRELVTEPGNVIYPESFVARAKCSCNKAPVQEPAFGSSGGLTGNGRYCPWPLFSWPWLRFHRCCWRCSWDF